MRIYGGRPLSRLEAGLYTAIAGVVLAIFASRLLHYMEAAERAAMEATVTQIMSRASTRLAYAVMRGQAEDVSTWSKRNPFEIAGLSPRNFVGEVDPARLENLERGTWAYDARRGELIYLPRLRSGLETFDPAGALRFRVVVGPGGMSYMLVPTSPFTWE